MPYPLRGYLQLLFLSAGCYLPYKPSYPFQCHLCIRFYVGWRVTRYSCHSSAAAWIGCFFLSLAWKPQRRLILPDIVSHKVTIYNQPLGLVLTTVDKISLEAVILLPHVNRASDRYQVSGWSAIQQDHEEFTRLAWKSIAAWMWGRKELWSRILKQGQ